jgi:hypothetical protein
MKKQIWYSGNNVQFFDSKPEGQQGNVNSFTVDTDSGEITGLNLTEHQGRQQHQPQSA